MNIIRIIEKKRDKEVLSKEEIEWFVKEYTNGTMEDYQASSLLMAIVLNGMTKEECVNLTMAMANSGEILDLSSINGIKCDKHSTGGVGDKTTLVLAPLVASCGVPVAKMSGRGLGHTGGTLDKIESIEGAEISMSMEQFIKQVNEIGIAVAGQTGNLAPADKKLYALRDVTGTVQSTPLIASSIMSKKIASGADAIVLDVKTGGGAFMKSIDAARELAKTMVDIGNGSGRVTKAVITNMEEPLGFAVGNSIEVIEAIETLKGNGPKDLLELVLELGSQMLINSKCVGTTEAGKKLLQEKIYNGEGLKKLVEFIKIQGGNSEVVMDYSKFKQPKYKVEIVAKEDGYIEKIIALKIGEAAMELGAGRRTKDDAIDMSAGILFNKKVGDSVKKGEKILTYFTDKDDSTYVADIIENSISISKEKVEKLQLIYEII
ncbi:MAG: pyrimidine-nucleoside phosphorylase [Lachnospirales bacterium]